jgi:hypothetical protein
MTRSSPTITAILGASPQPFRRLRTAVSPPIIGAVRIAASVCWHSTKSITRSTGPTSSGRPGADTRTARAEPFFSSIERPAALIASTAGFDASTSVTSFPARAR